MPGCSHKGAFTTEGKGACPIEDMAAMKASTLGRIAGIFPSPFIAVYHR